eukprot:Nk52_evm52s2657 gene=Nk52_evmTU52s2657
MFNKLSQLFVGSSAEEKENASQQNSQKYLAGKLFQRKDGNETCVLGMAEMSINSGDKIREYKLLVDNTGAPVNSGPNQFIFDLDYSLKFRPLDETEMSAFLFERDNIHYAFLYDEEENGGAFYQTVLKCLYEGKHKEDSCNATEEELKGIAKEQVSAPVEVENTSTQEKIEVCGNVEFECRGDFYVFDRNTRQFEPRAVNSRVLLNKVSKFERILYVCVDDTEAIFAQTCTSGMNLMFEKEHRAVIWISMCGGVPMSCSLRLQNEKDELQFKEKISIAIYEEMNQSLFSKVKEEDESYVMKSYDVPMEDVEEEAYSEDEEEYYSEEEDDNVDVNREKPNMGAGHNSSLAVGYKTDRSFVVRGNQIGVFKTGEDVPLEFSTCINNIHDIKGNTFSPAKVMLHKGDRSLLMLNPEKENHVYEMDLERGSVVNEWKTSDTMAISAMTPNEKYSQKTDESTFVGLNKQSLFRIDPRVKGDKVVEKETFSYAASTNPKLSCVATTGKGELAVGSAKGDIRLFSGNGINKRAKTHLPGFGDPIIGIDVSEDGRWVLATCETYILAIDTQVDDGNKYSGFSKSMGAKKPAPKRLQLKPEHVAFMGNQVKFTHARFNTGEYGEKFICTSSGPFVITWNFRQVKLNKLYGYQIKQYTDNVVADQFQHNQDKSIVVTLPDDVTVVTKTHMSTPTKQYALHTPRGTPRGTPSRRNIRDSIVNSPY